MRHGIHIFSSRNLIFVFGTFDVDVVEIGLLCENSSLLMNIKTKNPTIIDNIDNTPPNGV